MSFGGGSTSTASTEPSRVLSLQVSQSTYGTAIPRVWGKHRVSGNLLGYYDFTARKVESASSSGGGKGGGGGGSSASPSYTWAYSSAMAIALSSGQIQGVGKVWVDKSTRSLAEMGFALKDGMLGQAPWAYLQAHHPSEAVGYSGIAYVTSDYFDLGDDPSSPQLSFEVLGEKMGGNGDAVPADILRDIWTDEVEGLGLAESGLQLSDYIAWCGANDFTLSLLADTQRGARDWLRMILDATLTEAVPSQGGIKLVPLGDEAIGAWVPNSTPVYDITEDDVLAEPTIRRGQPRECKNKFTVEYADRDRDYRTIPVTASDITHVNLYGENSETKSLPCITRSAMASKVAESLKSRGLYTLCEIEIRLDERFCLLEPEDLVTLTFPAYGLVRFPLRVKEILHGEDGEITLLTKEWPAGVASPAVIQTQPASGYVPNYNTAPGNANTPVLLEPPVSLAGQPELWLATSGGSNWGGAEVWVSLDDASYSKAGTINSPARHGTLTATYPLASDPDNANTLAVDVSVSGAQLQSVSAAVRDLFESLCWVGNTTGGELIAYQGATLTGVGQYNLTNCRRGAHGSKRSAHAAGQQFVRLDGAQFRYPYATDLIGQVIYIKLRSFNKFGGNLQSLADVAALAYEVKGAPLGIVSGLSLEAPFTGTRFAVKWDAYPGAVRYELVLWYANAPRKVVGTSDTRFVASVPELVSWGIGRTVELRVVAVAASGVSTEAAVLIATKPQCAAPTVAVQDTASSMIVTASQSADAAYKATRICISQESGFDPEGVAPYYDGPQTAYPSGKIAAGIWYIRATQYDQFGPDSLNWTSEVALTVAEAATGVPRVANAASITAAPGSQPPNGEAYWAVFDNATGKIWRWNTAAGAYTKAADGGDLIAATVAADKIAAASLSAISAYLGNILSATMELVAGTGWSYIRTGSKWWADGLNGWVTAARAATGSFFQEFRIAFGSGLVLEQKGGGPDVGNSVYYLYIKDRNGVERVVLDPQAGYFKMKGRFEADDGYFAATLASPSGTFGTITAGILRNSSDTTRFNLNETGSGEVFRLNGQTRMWGDGRVNWHAHVGDVGIGVWQNCVWYDYRQWQDVEGNTQSEWIGHEGCELIYDTGIPMSSLVDPYNATYKLRPYGWDISWDGGADPYNQVPNFEVLTEQIYEMPLANGRDWSNVTLRYRITIRMRGHSVPAGGWIRINALYANILRHS